MLEGDPQVRLSLREIIPTLLALQILAKMKKSQHEASRKNQYVTQVPLQMRKHKQ